MTAAFSRIGRRLICALVSWYFPAFLQIKSSQHGRVHLATGALEVCILSHDCNSIQRNIHLSDIGD